MYTHMPEPFWNFPVRSMQKEILDSGEVEPAMHQRNLRELARVNRYLGGLAILRSGLKALLEQCETDQAHIIDVGCGGGDNLIAMAEYARKIGIKCRFTGIDLSETAVAYARDHTIDYPEITIRRMDVFSHEFRNLRADIFTFNLVLHHFEDQSIPLLLADLNSRGSILINDLQRNRLAHFLFPVFSRLFRFSFIGHHDGMLSIRRSFTRNHWQMLLANRGINASVISWRWAFRYLVLIPKQVTN